MTENIPISCTICLSNVVLPFAKLEGFNNENYENCLLRLFGIESNKMLSSLQPPTLYCENCRAEILLIIDVYAQLDLFQENLNKLKDNVESEFKKSFGNDQNFDAEFIGGGPESQRKDILRYEIARSLKLLTEEPPPPSPIVEFKEFTEEEFQDSPLEDSKYDENQYDNLPNAKLPSKSKNIPPNKKRRGRPKRSEATSQNAILTGNPPELKDLKIQIQVLPPNLLKNLPIHVQDVPGYRVLRSKKPQQYNKFLEESDSDVCFVSEVDPSFDEDSEDSLDFKIAGRPLGNKKPGKRKRISNQSSNLNSSRRAKSKTKRNKQRRHSNARNPDLKNPTLIKQSRNVVKRKEDGSTNLVTGSGNDDDGEFGSTPKKKRIRNKNHCRYYCDRDDCTKRFNRQEQLDIHIKQVHEGVTFPFKCDECDKTFRLRQQLKIHTRTRHLGQFNHICDVCGHGCTSLGNLKHHYVKHTNERAFKCPECPIYCKTSHGRVLHMRYAHTGERPFSCDRCGKGFVSSTKLRNHMKCIHDKERPFICHICGKDFPIQGYLYMHMRTHTNVESYPSVIKKKGQGTARRAAPNLNSGNAGEIVGSPVERTSFQNSAESNSSKNPLEPPPSHNSLEPHSSHSSLKPHSSHNSLEPPSSHNSLATEKFSRDFSKKSCGPDDLLKNYPGNNSTTRSSQISSCDPSTAATTSSSKHSSGNSSNFSNKYQSLYSLENFSKNQEIHGESAIISRPEKNHSNDSEYQSTPPGMNPSELQQIYPENLKTTNFSPPGVEPPGFFRQNLFPTSSAPADGQNNINTRLLAQQSYFNFMSNFSGNLQSNLPP